MPTKKKAARTRAGKATAKKATAKKATAKKATAKKATAKKATAKKATAKKATAKKAAKPARRPKAPDPEKMMAAWQAAMTPADGHRRLEPIVGTFDARTTFWMSPGAPPDASDGTSEHRWVLGGRYVEQAYRGTAMGMPFEGIGYTGYDNVQRKYVGSWMDNMGTGIMNSVGKGKATDDKMTFTGRMHDPLNRKEVELDMVLKVRDRDHHTFEMFGRSPDGKRFRSMLIEYTRRA